MSTLTPNLFLTKPDGADSYDIAVPNSNLDIMDGLFHTSGHNHQTQGGPVQRLANPTAIGVPATGFPQIARVTYDFATDGGVVGTINLRPSGASQIPSNSVIMGGWLRVTSILTSGGGATAAIQVNAANDIINAAAIAGAPWSTTGFKSVIPVFTGATMFITTAARSVSLVIGAANLTGGVFDVFLLYCVVA